MTRSETLAETVHALHKIKAQPPVAVKRRANRLMAGVVALAMIAGSAMPAQADKRGDNLAKALAAALAIGLVINAIDHNKHRTPQPQPIPEPVRQPRVPATCAIEMDSSQYGTISMYPERCLRSEGFNYRLPDCGRSVRIYGQPDWVYSGQCLREAGFRVDR
jgi:hypothetical protein